MIRALTSLLALLAAAFAVAAPAAAHEARPLYVEITETAPNQFDVRWRMPPTGLDGNRPTVSLEPCIAAGPARWAGAGGLVGAAQFHCEAGLGGAQAQIDYPRFNPAVSTLIHVSWLTGQTHTELNAPDIAAIALPDPENARGVAGEYFVLGVEHILIGYDHLLFIACLVIIAGTFRRILFTITGFTIAHSLTLALAALDIVRIPVPAVEAAIALSIVFLAVEIARGDRTTLAWRYPVTVSCTFGLLHGFGFASVLGEIGLPQTEIPAALLFFNLGVEAGQILFVAALALVLLAVRAAPAIGPLFAPAGNGDLMPARFNLPIAYGVGTLASFWMISRVAGFA